MKDRTILDALLDRVVGPDRPIQDRLAELMQDHNLNQYELAVLCGVSEATMSRWISGERTPRGLQTYRLLDFIDLELSRR